MSAYERQRGSSCLDGYRDAGQRAQWPPGLPRGVHVGGCCEGGVAAERDEAAEGGLRGLGELQVLLGNVDS